MQELLSSIRLYDVKTRIPCFVPITSTPVNDIMAMDIIVYEQGNFYIFDRGYNDFERLYRIHKQKAFFIFRTRDNIKFKRMYSAKSDKANGVMSDQTDIFFVWKSHRRYSEKLRKIKYVDLEAKKEFIFLTNNFELKAADIALLYRTAGK